jgi:hypothetical protein
MAMIGWFLTAVVLGMTAAGLYPVARAVRSRRTGGKPAGARDRGDVLVAVTSDVALLLLGRALIEWTPVQAMLWLVALALTAATLVLGGLVWDRLPWLGTARRRLRVVSVAFQLAIALAISAIVV